MNGKQSSRLNALEAKIGGTDEFQYVILCGDETDKELLAERGLTSDEGVLFIRIVGEGEDDASN